MILKNIKMKVDVILKWLLVLIMAAMTLNVLWQVFSRFILQNPSSYTEELARYMLIWIGLLGASYVSGQKMHLAIDLLSTKLKGKNKSMLEIVIQLFVLLFAFFVMVVGGIRLVQITLTLNQISAALQIPLGYVYTVVPISGSLMVFYSIYYMVQEFRYIKSLVK